MNYNPNSYGGLQGPAPDPNQNVLASNQPGSNPNNYPNNPYGAPPPNTNYPNNPYGAPPPATPGAAPYDPYAVPPTVAANPANPYPAYPPNSPGANPPNPYPPYPNNVPPPPNQAPNPYPYPGSMPPAYNAPPPFGGPPAPRSSSGGKIVLIVLAVLVVLGGLVAAIGVSAHNNQVAADNTHATATASARNTTATAQAQATTTAQAQATATAIASNYPFSTNVKLNDPLTDNSKGAGWRTDNNCKFASDGYHASEATTNTYYTCPALQTSYSNFTYQVTMNITQGSAAGITFRGDDANTKFYSFIFSQTGEYVLFLYTQSGVKPQTLQDSTTTTFHANQTNDLAVVARGNQISLYVNNQKLITISNGTYSSGQIGTIVYNLSGPVEAVFSNAKVWQL
jgi:hypothetical protein